MFRKMLKLSCPSLPHPITNRSHAYFTTQIIKTVNFSATSFLKKIIIIDIAKISPMLNARLISKLVCLYVYSSSVSSDSRLFGHVVNVQATTNAHVLPPDICMSAEYFMRAWFPSSGSRPQVPKMS